MEKDQSAGVEQRYSILCSPNLKQLFMAVQTAELHEEP